MKSLKKAALDFNPVLDVISPTLPHSASQIYEPSAQSDHVKKTPKKWSHLILNWHIYFDKAVKHFKHWFYRHNNTRTNPHIPPDYKKIVPLPIIKATTHFDYAQTVQKSVNANEPLLGQTFLCVGGRASLYSAYDDAIRSIGGNLLTFHGNVNDSIERMYVLLEQADMVICPIDCIRHDLFFAVKHFCQYTNKPCALLDRSEINTFRKGIEILVNRH